MSELNKVEGVESVALNMPDPNVPTIDKWTGALAKELADRKLPKKSTIIVGHSVGSQTVMRHVAKAGGDEPYGAKPSLLALDRVVLLTPRAFRSGHSAHGGLVRAERSVGDGKAVG